MLDRTRLPLLWMSGVCALALACDALPKFQFQLQRDIQREFHLTSAMVMVIDTTYMVVAVFDDVHAAFDPKKLVAFQEEVAHYAVMHYTHAKLKTIGVVVDRASQRGGSKEQPAPTVFVPEYHPDGTVRLAGVPPRRTITTQVRNRAKQP